jgi:hypothetical protein
MIYLQNRESFVTPNHLLGKQQLCVRKYNGSIKGYTGCLKTTKLSCKADVKASLAHATLCVLLKLILKRFVGDSWFEIAINHNGSRT